jgi:hypothetical protein
MAMKSPGRGAAGDPFATVGVECQWGRTSARSIHGTFERIAEAKRKRLHFRCCGDAFRSGRRTIARPDHPDNAKERGLFLAYRRSISQQYETLHSKRMNDDRAPNSFGHHLWVGH